MDIIYSSLFLVFWAVAKLMYKKEKRVLKQSEAMVKDFTVLCSGMSKDVRNTTKLK